MSKKNSPTADHTLSLGLPAHSLVRQHSRISCVTSYVFAASQKCRMQVQNHLTCSVSMRLVAVGNNGICQAVNRNTHKSHTYFRRRQADTRTSSSARCSLGFAQSCRWALCTWTSLCSEHSTSTNARLNIPHLGGVLALVHIRLISLLLLVLRPHLLQLH